MLVQVDQKNGVGFLTIDNAPVNALSRELRQALLDTITSLSNSAEIQAIVLRGANGTFVAGADLREFGRPISAPALPEVIAAIEACPKPVVAAIRGFALGGGYELALGCDGRVAVVDAAVGLPEGTFGIIPGAGGAVRTTRLVDAAVALEMMASCRRIRAPEAKSLGLIDAIVDDLDAGAAAYAHSLRGQKRRLRDLPPREANTEAFEKASHSALRRGKNRPFAYEQVAAVKRAVSEPFDRALAAERAAFQRLRESGESAALRHLFFAERDALKVEGIAGVRPLPIRTVGIVGAGTMGCGIAAVFLMADFPVTLVDTKPEALAAAGERIAGYISRAPNPATIRLTDQLADLAGCDLVLEAVFEDMGVKRELMRALDACIQPDAILASNTSYLDLDTIAAATARPDRVVGLHFFAPAHIMKLLEIVRGARTSATVLSTALELGRSLGKVSVVSRVGEGFIGNRIYNAYRAECEAMLLKGALPQKVDSAIEAFGFSMGPFAASDLSGLDIAWANRRRKQTETGMTADVPILEWLVAQGRLGRKTGAGWYRYDDAGKRACDESVAALVAQARAERGMEPINLRPQDIQARALTAIVNEALLVLEDGIAARPSDIDLVLTNGYGFPRYLGGPLFWAKAQDRTDLNCRLNAYVSGQEGGRRGDLNFLGQGAGRATA